MSFKRLDTEDFVVSAESITAPAWSTNNPVLELFGTDDTQVGSQTGLYYISVYNNPDLTAEGVEVQFDVAFGAKDGRGSTYFYSRNFHPQLHQPYMVNIKNLIYGDENNDFIFGGVSQSYFYAITLDRSRYKEKLLPGTFNLKLPGGLNLTDNSKDQSTLSFTEAGRVYQIVNGENGQAASIEDTPSNAVSPGMTKSGSYGLFLPDIGTIILNARALDLSTGDGGITLNTEYTDNEIPTSPPGSNALKLVNNIQTGASFQLNSEETVSSDFIFVRARKLRV